jgi:hypothetical protein
VGHQVIESIAKIGYIKTLFLQFYHNQLDTTEFYKQQQKKRSIMRYYSYMDRNPTGKNSLRRRLIIKKHKLRYSLKNSDKLLSQVSRRFNKSIKKRINKTRGSK